MPGATPCVCCTSAYVRILLLGSFLKPSQYEAPEMYRSNHHKKTCFSTASFGRTTFGEDTIAGTNATHHGEIYPTPDDCWVGSKKNGTGVRNKFTRLGFMQAEPRGGSRQDRRPFQRCIPQSNPHQCPRRRGCAARAGQGAPWLDSLCLTVDKKTFPMKVC